MMASHTMSSRHSRHGRLTIRSDNDVTYDDPHRTPDDCRTPLKAHLRAKCNRTILQDECPHWPISARLDQKSCDAAASHVAEGASERCAPEVDSRPCGESGNRASPARGASERNQCSSADETSAAGIGYHVCSNVGGCHGGACSWFEGWCSLRSGHPCQRAIGAGARCTPTSVSAGRGAWPTVNVVGILGCGCLLLKRRGGNLMLHKI
jgi:hypothetical protein